MQNKQISDVLAKIASILDILDENPFRVRSYKNAARIIEDSPVNITDLVAAGSSLEGLAGIGKSMVGHITEIINTGSSSVLEELSTKIPLEITYLLKIEGLGPKKVKLLYEKLGITSVDDLDDALDTGKLHGIEGMGDKTLSNLKRSIQNFRSGQGRFKISTGLNYAVSFCDYLAELSEVEQIEPAGSLRRRKETVGDLDLLVACSPESRDKVMEHFVSHPEVSEVMAQGETKSSVRLFCGLQIDLRAIEKESFGAALQYFTGSQAHNVALRKRAMAKDCKINEYGVFDKDGKYIAGIDENDVYGAVGLAWVPPELREDRGEFTLAEENRLPDLVSLEEVKGDLQMHTRYSDGKDTALDMALKARELGYEYIAITNHSQAVRIANGLDGPSLLASFEEIETAQAEVPEVRVLKSVEVDILADGSLDLEDSVLAECDVVVAAIHSGFNMPEGEMTERIIKGISNPYVNILAHPTGRLIPQRPPYPVDIENVIRTAVVNDVYMEINAYPERLDLNDIHARLAKELGAKMVISTDAHAAFQMEMMRYGVFVARRAGLEACDVVNTLPLDAFLESLKK